MVELFEQDIRKQNHQSSKGNQLKWENEGIWYKADYTGYEGLSEYVISHLLEKSSLKKSEYVLYDTELMKYKRRSYHGAKSMDFLKDDWQIITLERLFYTRFGRSLYKSVWQLEDVDERFSFLVNVVQRMTGLDDFDVYLSKLFTIDAFFLNEDRHMHNIAVLMNHKGEFDYCPVFDNGEGLLSDTTLDYPMEEDIYELMSEVEAKSISSNFDQQLDSAEKLSGIHLKFSFTRADVKELLENDDIYPADMKERIYKIISEQMRKYKYLF